MNKIAENNIIYDILNSVHSYLKSIYDATELTKLDTIILSLVDVHDFTFQIDNTEDYSYEDIQKLLANYNEKESIRKSKGVYYTPTDIVRFILLNSIKSFFDKLKTNNIHVLDLNGIPYKALCFEKNFLDPTCGTGEFLLSTLEIKMDLLDAHLNNVTKSSIEKIVTTIYGNDINKESTSIAKLRLFLCLLQRYGAKKCSHISEILNHNFTNYDFVTTLPPINKNFDIIIGNPPYVEDSKSNLTPIIKYGNIYANVLCNSEKLLNSGGVIGFIIPLSYVSTPRMKNLRNSLLKKISEQYILSYADRPDCLFCSVHQKLCVLIGKKCEKDNTIFTGNYQYWYKEERARLFEHTMTVKNNFFCEFFIPKLGTETDVNVYKKVHDSTHKKSLLCITGNGDFSVYLNMRSCFWIKAFRMQHEGAEYKKFNFETENLANYFFCLVNSSLFWWYWICVSDCWHITNKELQGFRVPECSNYNLPTKLAALLEEQLETTKLYVGTKQTEYEYKHKLCTNEIHLIDDFVNEIFGLTKYEGLYIKNFAYRYRIGGGVEYSEGD